MANAVRAQNEHTQGNLKPFVDIRSISHASSSCAEHDQMKIKKLTITAQCPTIRWKSTPLEPLSRDQENVSMSLCVDGYTNHDICMLQTFPIHNQTNALINVNPSLSNIFKYNSFEQYRIKWFQINEKVSQKRQRETEMQRKFVIGVHMCRLYRNNGRKCERKNFSIACLWSWKKKKAESKLIAHFHSFSH